MKLKKEKGITLIALVVTIVVLLILAGVSTNILFSDSGLIEKAQNSGLKIRAAQVEEVVANWKQSNFINSSINKQKETADKMLEDLISKKLVTEDEIDKEQEKIIEIQEAETEQFEDSVESANIQNKKAFVIREEDGYLNVYFGEEDALYMYTGIAYQGLPEELKKEISNGKTFDTLEDLYRFLESYSS